MKKFLAIALILVTAGCAREEAGPVRYDRMELIYHHYEFAQDPREFARNAVDVIRKSKRKTTIYRTANITGQDTLSFISSRIYSAEADTLPSQSPYIKMVALLHNEDRTDTLSSTMWFEGLYVYLLDILRDRDIGAYSIYFYYDGCYHWYPKGYSRQFPEGVDQSIRDSLFSWRDTLRISGYPTDCVIIDDTDFLDLED